MVVVGGAACAALSPGGAFGSFAAAVEPLSPVSGPFGGCEVPPDPDSGAFGVSLPGTSPLGGSVDGGLGVEPPDGSIGAGVVSVPLTGSVFGAVDIVDVLKPLCQMSRSRRPTVERASTALDMRMRMQMGSQ